MRTRTLLIISALVIALALAGCTTKVVTPTEGAAPLNTVTAAGEGMAPAAPDMARMNFGVTVQETEAQAALDAASATAAAITDAVKKAGIDSKDIQTANVSLYPQQDYREGKAPVILGYQASINVSVKIRDLASLGDVIAAATNAGATDIGGPSFMLEDDAEASDAAIADAVNDARTRAEAMAKAAGKTVGEVIAISETGVTVPTVTYERAYAADMAQSVPIEPGQLDISANVTVIFELK